MTPRGERSLLDEVQGLDYRQYFSPDYLPISLAGQAEREASKRRGVEGVTAGKYAFVLEQALLYNVEDSVWILEGQVSLVGQWSLCILHLISYLLRAVS